MQQSEKYLQAKEAQRKPSDRISVVESWLRIRGVVGSITAADHPEVFQCRF